MKSAFMGLFFVLLVSVQGQIFIVDPGGGGDFETIQEAVFYAWHGDSVLVYPGLYEEDIAFGGRDVTLTSLDPEDPNVVRSTVINGTVYFDLGESELARLEGFTILSNAFNATSDSYTQEQPAVSWPWLLWTDQRNSNKDIYGRNLETSELTAVCTNSAAQEYPDVHSDLAVWQDLRNSNYDIYGKNLATGDEIPICTLSSIQNDPAVCGDVVVWRDFRNGNYDIYGKNLANGNELEICIDPASQFNPDVDEDIVVWSDQRNSATTSSDIYGKNLATGIEFEICTAEGAQTHPLISGNIVVWRDQRNGNYDIYGKNLTSGEDLEICTLESAQTFLGLSGNLVVWQDDRNGNEDIYGKDLSTGQEFVISSASGNQTVPVIEGKYVAWQDQRTALAEIYWYDLHYPVCSRTVTEGIICWNAEPVIRYCTFLGCSNYGVSGIDISAPAAAANTFQYCYGGIYGCSGPIEHNVFANNEIGIVECNGILSYNTAAYNNVCAMAFCEGLIVNNLIYRNHEAGIVDCDADIINNTIASNGGDGLVDCAGLVKNNIFAFNEGLGISGACENRYNAFWQNEAGSLGNGAVPGHRSILVDPHFADTEADDYHLLSEAGRWNPVAAAWVVDLKTSRCIDIGDPADETVLELNPNGGRINLGAYGGTMEASLSTAGTGPTWPCIDPPTMDSNGDCKIDLIDLAALCSQWLACGRQSPDACWP